MNNFSDQQVILFLDMFMTIKCSYSKFPEDAEIARYCHAGHFQIN